MKGMWWRRAGAIGAGRRAWLVALLLAIAAVFAPPAQAGVGYELNPSTPSQDLDGVPRGIAVDQASRDLYIAIISGDLNTLAGGWIERFNSDLSDDGTFAKGGYYSGVAVNPLTHGFYGFQVEIPTQFGTFGSTKLDRFSSAGVLAGSTALTYPNAWPTIATDSAGNVFFPNRETHSVQVFNSAGVLQEEITCGGCTGGPLGAPIAVATSAANDLYVVDAAPDRVVKLSPSGGSYSFASVLQSGRNAGAVAVDPGSGDVLVGDMANGRSFHMAAYHSSGIQFDDFGGGLFLDASAESGAYAASQMAIDETSHRLYVTAFEKFFIFDRVTTAHPPTATIAAATNVGQLSATLNATASGNGHAVFECEFEYVDHGDFLGSGYANATTGPCLAVPSGSGDTATSAKASGLQPETTYHFRVTATSYAGTVSSNSETFETLPVVPATVTSEPASTVTLTGAKFNATVNPHGGSVSNCHFEYGTSASYGTSLSCSFLPGPVSTEVAETRTVSSLVPGTTYHYRLVVTTNAGTAKGNDVEFRTASPPAEPEPEPESIPPSSTPAAPTPPPVTTPPSGGPGTTPRPLRCKKGFHKRRIHGKARCVKKRQVR
jgi:hypothetical protein